MPPTGRSTEPTASTLGLALAPTLALQEGGQHSCVRHSSTLGGEASGSPMGWGQSLWLGLLLASAEPGQAHLLGPSPTVGALTLCPRPCHRAADAAPREPPGDPRQAGVRSFPAHAFLLPFSLLLAQVTAVDHSLGHCLKGDHFG